MNLCDSLRLEPDSTAVVSLVGGGGKTTMMRRLVREAAERGMRPIATTTTQLGAAQAAGDPALVPVLAESVPWADLERALDAHHRALVGGPEAGDKRRGVLPTQVDQIATRAQSLGVRLIVVEADGSRHFPVKAPADYEPVVPVSTTHLVPVMGIAAIGRRLVEGQVHRPERLRAVLEVGETADARLSPAMAAALAIHPQGGAKARPEGAHLHPAINSVEAPHELAIARLVTACWERAGQSGLITAVGRTDRPPVVERWGPWGVVILAAGESRRMGRAKQLISVNGEPMVRRALRIALSGGAFQVVVVTGADAEGVTAAVNDLASTDRRVRIAHNAAWHAGQAGSLQTGLRALDPRIQAAAFLLADQPYVPALLLRRLIKAWRGGAPLSATAVDGELRGAPTLFDRSFFPMIHEVQGDRGGRAILEANLESVTPVPAPPAWLVDMDTPEDLP